MTRYRARADEPGYEVFDLWTNQTVVMQGVSQAHMAFNIAAETALLLNLRAADGARDILQ